MCVGWISDPPLTEYRIYPIKYLNRGLFRVMQTLGGHNHFGGYDQPLFYRLKNRVGLQIIPFGPRIKKIEPVRAPLQIINQPFLITPYFSRSTKIQHLIVAHLS